MSTTRMFFTLKKKQQKKKKKKVSQNQFNVHEDVLHVKKEKKKFRRTNSSHFVFSLLVLKKHGPSTILSLLLLPMRRKP